MRKLLLPLFALSAALATVAAQADTPATATAAPMGPSTASIEHLLDVSHAQRLIGNLQVQIASIMRNSARQTGQMKHLSGADQALLNQEVEKLLAEMNDFLAWDRMKTVYVDVYSQTFTQKEVDALTAFYSTTEGQSILLKLPAVMQKCAAILQPQIMQRMQQSQAQFQEFVAQLATKHAAPGSPTAPPPAKQS